MRINCDGYKLQFDELNEQIRQTSDKEIIIDGCMGQRYIGAGVSEKSIVINGTAGNALGAYLDGAKVVVNGNAQDATGDTMNKGEIIIHGSCGDATGYAMRGGQIYIKGNAGYRAGIHMKAYKENLPVLVIGGKAGSFLGEYQAGGLIVVLGIDTNDKYNVGYMCGTGMHGGKIFLRSDELPFDLPPQVAGRTANEEDLKEISAYVDKFCQNFGYEKAEIMKKKFFVLEPNAHNPYRQLYTYN